MPMKPVDTAIKIILGPCIDDGDFKSREEGLTYNQAGIEIDVILEKADGTVTTTAVTPTNTGGNYDWAHTNQGYYEMELPASGGASYNNDTEGILTVVGYCTGVLPFKSVSYDIVPAKVYNSLVAGSDNLEVDSVQISGDGPAADNCELMFDGTGYAGGTARLKVDVDTIKTQAITCAAGVTVLDSVGTVGASIAQTGDAYVDTELIKAVTEKLDTALELDGVEYRFTENALEEAPSPSSTDIMDEVVEGALTMKEALRLFLAVLVGKCSGGGSSTIIFKDTTGAINRVTATVDTGGRSAVTLNVT